MKHFFGEVVDGKMENSDIGNIIEKAGFETEGTMKESVYREGERYDEWVLAKVRK